MSFHFEKPADFEYRAGQFADYTLLSPPETESGHTIFVFYSNNRTEDAAFMDEFEAAATANDNLTVVATMTEPDRSKQAWDGETGFVDKDMIARYVDDLTTPIYYLCGPGGMVTAMRTLLNAAGVDDDDIRTEEFTGY